MKEFTKKEKEEWIEWLRKYGVENFLNSFLQTVEGAESTCKNCGEKIYVDIMIGGGCPDWSTKDGDFGCEKSPETCEEGCGGHVPIKKDTKYD